jgi:cytidylate kinase
MDEDGRQILIGVVGVCGSGKSTLAAGLRRHGVAIRHIAQEHSYVPYMWQRITNPDLLIFLDASYPVTMRRRWLNWLPEEYQEQQHRLRHAREHANFYLDTDPLSPEEVLERVVAFLRASGVLLPDNPG